MASARGVLDVDPVGQGSHARDDGRPVLQHGRDQGRIPESKLARLSTEARRLIDERINLAQWYPMKPFVELLDLDWKVSGNRAPNTCGTPGC